MWDECRQMARDDPDFAAIRGVAAFEALVDRTLR
jgi:hypothetical protein